MARVHMNVRVTAEVLAGVDAYAEERSITRSAATEQLLQSALEADEREQPIAGNQGADVMAAMQAHITTLHEQLAMKDEQIARLNKTADQAQVLQMRLMNALPMAQEPDSGQDAPQPARDSQEHPQDATDGQERPQERKRGFWASLWS